MVNKKDDENFEIEDKPKKRGRPKKSAAKETKIVDSVPAEQEEIFINEQALLNEIPHEIGLLSLRGHIKALIQVLSLAKCLGEFAKA